MTRPIPKRTTVLRAATIAVVSLFVSLGPASAESPHPPEAIKPIKVFILAGQSNMEGRANGALLTAEDRERLTTAQERVQLAFNEGPARPLDVVQPARGIAKSYKRDLIFGPELFFGITLSERWPDERVLLIKLTAGGTSLYGCWNPDWTADKAALMDEERDPKLYPALTDYIAETLSGYKPEDYEICAMLWVQGESDSHNETAAAAYGDNLASLVKATREDLSQDHLPFLLFQVGRGEVVEGMKRVARDVPNVTILPQSQDPASPDFYNKMKNGHYNYEGMKKLGRRFAEAYLDLYHGR